MTINGNGADPYNDVPEGDPAWAAPRRKRNDVRSSAAYRQLQAQFREECRRHRNRDGSYGLPCAVPGCGRPINYNLRYPHPQAFQLDHDLPVSTHPQLALVPSNFRPSHAICNQRRAGELDDDADLDLGVPSEEW